MIIIPEKKIILILTPRTGSGALRRAVKDKYPESIMLYRHMEADGVPHGYDRWKKFGVVRDPVERLWSLWKYLQNFGDQTVPGKYGQHEENYVAHQRKSGSLPFRKWITDNEIIFTSHYSIRRGMECWPIFQVLHAMPENRKSQFIYLRPDLGTQIVLYERLYYLTSELGLTMPENVNRTAPDPSPILDLGAINHMQRFFEWEYSLGAWSLP